MAFEYVLRVHATETRDETIDGDEHEAHHSDVDDAGRVVQWFGLEAAVTVTDASRRQHCQRHPLYASNRSVTIITHIVQS